MGWNPKRSGCPRLVHRHVDTQKRRFVCSCECHEETGSVDYCDGDLSLQCLSTFDCSSQNALSRMTGYGRNAHTTVSAALAITITSLFFSLMNSWSMS